jgi:hypothetical protein
VFAAWNAVHQELFVIPIGLTGFADQNLQGIELTA